MEEKKTKHKNWVIELLLIAILIVVGAFLIRYAYYERTYVNVEGTLYLKGEPVDYRDRELTPEEYEQLCEKYPDVEFLWLVPVCGMRLEPDTTELAVPAGADYAELEASLELLPDLQAVDLSNAGFTNAQNAAFAEEHPELQVTYLVSMDGKQYDPETTEFQLEYRDDLLDILKETAPMFVNGIQVVDFSDTVISTDMAIKMREELNAEIRCDFSFYGVQVPWDADELNLADIYIDDTSGVDEAIAAMPNLKTVDMDNTGLSNDTLDALNLKYPDVDIVWTIYVWGEWQTFSLRTDREHLCLSQFSWASYPGFGDDGLYALRYCHKMITLDLGHTDITNIDMCAYMPNLRFMICADTGVTSLEPLQNCYDLYYLEAQFCRISDFSPLADKTNLRHLNVSYTRCADSDLLSTMTWLDRLWIKCTRLSGRQEQVIKNALPDTMVVWDDDYYGDNAVADGFWRDDDSYYEMRDNLGLAYMS